MESSLNFTKIQLSAETNLLECLLGCIKKLGNKLNNILLQQICEDLC